MRFERECHAVGAVSNHPNIVAVHEGGFTGDDRAYLVMEFFPGGSLLDRIQRDGPMSAAEAMDVGVKIGRALGVAHRTGVLHRDVKPANILVSAYGEPALADFGIARVEGGQQTATGLVTASFAHAAPEVLEGKGPTARSDVYSLGSTLYELCVGHAGHVRPADESVWALMNRVITEPFPDPGAVGIPEPLASTIRLATAKDPADRHPSADDLVASLAGAGAGAGAGAVAVASSWAPPVVGSGVPDPGHSEPPHPNDPDRGRTTTLPTGGPDTSGAPTEVWGAPTVDQPAAGPPVSPDSMVPPDRLADAGLSTGTMGGPPDPLDHAGRPAPTERGGADSSERVMTDGGAGPGSVEPVPVRPRRWGPRVAVVGVVLVALSIGAAGLWFARREPAPPPVALLFPAALDGPLEAGQTYDLTVEGGSTDDRYRILVDGEPVGTGPSATVPEYTAVEGRHAVEVEVTRDDEVLVTDPVDLYALGDPPELEYRVNLAAVPIDVRQWQATLTLFDDLVEDGHEGLEIYPNNRGFWILFVPGFGQDRGAGIAYCEEFELFSIDDCYTALYDPST